jgi:hypothetical protein
MRLYRSTMIVAGLLLAGPALASAFEAQLVFRWGTRERPLTGRRYETMRSLAHYLGERAQHAAEQAEASAHHGTRSERRLLADIGHFARQAGDFHERMDNYLDDPWDLPSEVAHLNEDARRVSNQIRRAHVFEHTWDDWNAVLDTMQQMNRLLAGYDVRVPSAHGDSEDDHHRYRRDPRDHDDHYSDDRGGRFEPGEWRDLARELDEEAVAVYDSAQRDADGSGRGQDFLGEMAHFNDRARALREQSASGRIDPREMQPTVNHLLEDARSTERSLDNAGMSRETRAAWARTVRTLERMASLVAE